MRERIWALLADTKFRALYAYFCYKKSGKYFRLSSLFIAITSASSITAWAAWKEVPTLWACIVAVSQLLVVATPYFPFLKSSNSFLEMFYEFEQLYIDLERLWYSLEDGNISSQDAEKEIYKYKERIIEIQKKHKDADCPECNTWMNKIDKETDRHMQTNFYR